MLFIGSKKYPSETKFVDFVSQHNGKFNGYTNTNFTGFFFKIHKDNFEEGLEIFTEFFKEPLFDEAYVEKEVNSVNSEFERNSQQDDRKKSEILSYISNPESSLHNFKTGNRETLLEYSKANKISLKQRVLEYYTKCYNPNNMKLLLLGGKDMSYYEDIAKKYFENIENKKPKLFGLNKKEFEKIDWDIKKELPFHFYKEGRLVFTKSVNNHKEIDIYYILPNIISNLPKNPVLYFKTVMNNQGNGSLLDMLRKKGLVSSLKSSSKNIDSEISLFKISAYITDKGIENLNEIFKTINSYVNFLKSEASNQDLYNKLKESYDKKFFKNKAYKGNLMKITKSIAQAITQYDKKYIFSQTKILPDYNEQDLLNFLEYLKPSNSIVIIGNKEFPKDKLNYLKSKVINFNGDFDLDSFEPNLKTHFKQLKMNKSFIDEIESYTEDKFESLEYISKNKDDEEEDDDEDLAPNNEIKNKNKNNKKQNNNVKKENEENTIQVNEDSEENVDTDNDKFNLKLCTSLETKKRKKRKKNRNNEEINDKELEELLKDDENEESINSKEECIKNNKKDSKDLTPVVILHNETTKVFHKQDRSFLSTKTNFVLRVILPIDINNVKDLTILRLFVFAVNIKIRDIYKDTQLGPNEIILKIDRTGFNIHIYGFSGSLNKTILTLLNGIKSLTLTQEDFTVIKEEMQKQFDGTINIIPKIKTIVNFFSIILEHYIPSEKILDSLHSINNHKKVNKIFNTYFNTCNLIILFHGNFTAKQALATVNLMEQTLQLKKLPENFKDNITLQNNHFDYNGSYIYRELLKKDFNYDHATNNFYKIGENSIKNNMRALLMKMVVGYIYFTELRVKQQLGYSTKGNLFVEGNELYFTITVQGSRVIPSEVDKKIEDLIPLMRNRIENVTEVKFQKNLKIVKNKLKVKDKTIKNRTDRLWKLINLGKLKYNDFNPKKKLLKAIKKVTKKKLLKFFNSVFVDNLKKISIQVFSKNVKKLPHKIPYIIRDGIEVEQKLIDDFDYFRRNFNSKK